VQDLQIKVKRSTGPPVVGLAGEVDMQTASEVRQTLEELIETDGLFELDLAAVTFIDSSGLHLLLDAANRLNGSGPLTLMNVPPRVLRLMEIVGLTEAPSLNVQKQDD
jgi:anti-sigma B factor antagonist